MHRYRFVLGPRWLALHVVVVAACITMVFLGRWQLDVSNSKHFDLQNFAYALQWWAFSIFTVLMWGRVMRDSATRPGGGPAEPVAAVEPPVAYRRYVAPAAPVETDPVRLAYNDYLRGLDEATSPPAPKGNA